MLDRQKTFEFSIESSVGQEQNWSMSRISDTQRGPFRSWKRASQWPHFACRKACQQRATVVEGAEMDDKEARRFRALAARLNFLAEERPYLLFASRCICKNMRRPRSEDWLALKRVGRDFKGATRMVKQFHWTGDDTFLQGDSDWAGDPQDMKSTSGGVIMRSGHCTKVWSTSQSVWALSSGEAELYAVIKVPVQLSGVIIMAKDIGISLPGVVTSDSISVIRTAHRDGLGGRCRHIKVQYSWIQSKIKDGDFKLQKVLTNNVADAMTKAVDRWDLDKYMATMTCVLMPGRADKASRALLSGALS